MSSRFVKVLFAATIAATGAGSASARNEIMIGHDGAGALASHKEFKDPEPLILDQIFPGFPDVAGAPVGFENVPMDTEELFTLPPTVNIALVVVSTTPGLTLYDSFTPLGPNDAVVFGPPFFDFHLVWAIDNGEPGVTYTFTGLVRDLNGVLSDSPPITIDFSLTPPACPGDHNNDLTVDFADITHVLANWSAPFTFASITTTMANFGAACP